ncbi:uncharacterized protein B0I36DRAFT_394484 [Microdochium trichocladiopsis]|uniref:Zn(2)-C6 fungal-type domain-containing protein n=1 Tax=Microdochium trichocladiopsis TaxID=1682393 RepID=A0A9P8XTR4_9PEZI|nr:uncharacterized protein B0I36DRAFT_394484 [Microdochium trichocladiopsis]KAH7017964.1 hypothetical protein B0I36DRAFT_394484 [Microdochium trichocladiopsis]
MSLARRDHGCPQCRRRRVRCDMAVPECQKCIKKGLHCSGLGFECRFSAHMNSSAEDSSPRRSASTTSSSPGTVETAQTRPGSAGVSPSPTKRHRRHRHQSSMNLEDQERRPPCLVDKPSNPQADYLLLAPDVPDHCPSVKDTGLDILVQPRTPQAMMLFSHFSEFIASKMVVFDSSDNGYRRIIMPMACQSDVVMRALSVVAAFHLAGMGITTSTASSLRAAAEAGQQAILSKLVQDSRQLNPDRVFSMSTWAAVLILLVGDTITGSDNYPRLLEMLRHVSSVVMGSGSSSPTSTRTTREETRDFLMQQTRMFELLGSALTQHEDRAHDILSGPVEPYLAFASPDHVKALSANNDSAQQVATVKRIRSAIQAACELCRDRLQRSVCFECPAARLDALQQLVDEVALPGVDGAHALVWPCFVAAAEAVLPRHRDFFSSRLRALFACTHFHTIPLALDTLTLIWEHQGRRKWTQIIISMRPILIM